MANEEQQAKLVPESDVLALKARLEKETGELKSQLDELRQIADTHYTSLLSEKAAKEKIAAELEELRKEAEQLRGLVPLKEKADSRIKELEQQLLDVSIKRITQVYKIPEDKLKGKTLAELASIEEALKLVGREAGRFDITGAGVATGTEKLTPREKMRLGFEQLKR